MNTAPGRACVAACAAGAEVIRRAHEARSSPAPGGEFAVDRKGRINLVTTVDHEAESAVVALLRERFPEVPILAEERGMVGGPAADRRFIVDPLDGTTNFAHGFPVFCVSVAYELDGEIVAGAVLDPTREELFTAEAGGGAFLNGAPIRVSDASDLEDALLATGFPYEAEAMDRALALFSRIMRSARAVRRAGSAALDLCSVAAGRLDGFWEEALRAWDTAAGELIVREAGGAVTAFDGGRFENGGPNIAATNGRLHPALLEVLRRSRASLDAGG